MLSAHWHDSLNLVDDGRGGRLARDDMPVNVRTVGWTEGTLLRFTRDTATGRGHDYDVFCPKGLKVVYVRLVVLFREALYF